MYLLAYARRARPHAIDMPSMCTLQPAGCTTPGSAIRVEAAQVRGVDSSGMICSAYDLGWAEEPDGTPAFVPRSAALGSPYPDEPFEVRSGACSSCRPVISSSWSSNAARGQAMLGPHVWCCLNRRSLRRQRQCNPQPRPRVARRRSPSAMSALLPLRMRRTWQQPQQVRCCARTPSCREH